MRTEPLALEAEPLALEADPLPPEAEPLALEADPLPPEAEPLAREADPLPPEAEPLALDVRRYDAQGELLTRERPPGKRNIGGGCREEGREGFIVGGGSWVDHKGVTRNAWRV